MPYSHHSHSGQFCKHANGTLKDVVLEAIRKGFRVYSLSEHVPRYRTEDLDGARALGAQFDAFLDEAHRLKVHYASQIILLVGLETDYITSIDLDRFDALLERHGDRIEYIVGSIHHVGGILIDFDIDTFNRALAHQPGGSVDEQMEAFLCSYFEAQFELMQRYRPEIIGHVDLCRLYNPQLRFAEYPPAWELLNGTYLVATEENSFPEPFFHIGTLLKKIIQKAYG
ncbi:hypothetical protein GYMLUDRAFT_241416 [Collybiopsis luxurians FD-317 M1]|uniref:Histidinol-phosphatase n=1 Tax=Collybiopsis luxurians FD-317 M1 TaxID=944289 RepID=A0A0D0D4D0_9AGAR|nr:hypothetical protein GYMLUDRAFT_241416 [Collybiopsis luxurians FD-317 M1]